MLDVLRSLELAIQSSKDSVDSTLEGVRLTAESMRSPSLRRGLLRLTLKEGYSIPAGWKQLQRFPRQRVVDSGKVLQVIETGYMIHDRVLKPAKVVVSE
jgi:molecular chaperone GrpE